MKLGWMATVVLIGAVSTVGCVSQKKYDEAVIEVNSARSELDKFRAQKNSLEQQVKTLKDLNSKFGSETQAAHDELERIQHGRDTERGSTESQIKKLEDRIRQGAVQSRSVHQEYEDLKRHNQALKSLVARYQKELKDHSRSAPRTLESAAPTPSAPAVAAPAAPVTRLPPAPSPFININKVSAGDIVLELGLPKDVADRIVAARPYRVKGELVAKNVMTKDIFDMIKDRISVGP